MSVAKGNIGPRMDWPEVVRLRELGTTWADIGRSQGVSASAVQHLWGRGGYSPTGPHPAKKFDREQMRTLRAGGMTHQAIADQFGVTRQAVTLALSGGDDPRPRVYSSKKRCSTCGEYGHNRRTCQP